MVSPVPKSVPLRREQLGDLVRARRDELHLSQHQLGRLIGGSQSKVNRIEQGKVAVKPKDLRALIDQLRVPPDVAKQMEELAGTTPQQKRGDNAPKHARRYLDAEPDAKLVRGFHSERLPGTLQSEMYLCRQADVATVAELTEELTKRLARKELLERADGPRFDYVLSESAVRRTVYGNNLVRLDQIRELLRITAAYQRVSVRILPFDAHIAHVPADFTLVSFADEKRNFVYIELGAGGVEPKPREQIDEYHDTWTTLSRAALSADESRAFLIALRNEYSAQ